MKKHRVVYSLLGIIALLAALSVSAKADREIEKNLKLDPGGRFVLDSDAGSVSITGTNESGAKVVITSNRDDLESLFHFNFAASPGEERVPARKMLHNHWMRNLPLHFEFRVP